MISNTRTIEMHTEGTQMSNWEKMNGSFKEQYPNLYESYLTLTGTKAKAQSSLTKEEQEARNLLIEQKSSF